MPETDDPSNRIHDLEARVASLAKTNAVLIRDAERRTRAEQSAFDLFQSAGILEERVRDRTARLQEAQERLKESLSLVRATLDSTDDGILVMNIRQKIVDYNAKFTKLWGVPAELMETGDGARLLEYIAKKMADPDAFLRNSEELFADPHNEIVDELFLNDGRVFERRSVPHRLGGETVGRVYCFRDVTAHRRAIEQLRSLANFDGLTGLANRVLFLEQLRQMLARAQRLNTLIAVLFLDLDRFKSVNDTLGHGLGDELLRAVAERVKKCLRENDIIARQGGDEITVGLGEIATPESAATVAARILSAFGRPFMLNGREVYSSASIGISVFPDHATDADGLLKTADSAMYLAKDLGRGNYQFYTPELTARAKERLQLESDLRRALENNEFVLHYQPQVDLGTGSLIGFEALVRWQHPEAGLLLPGKFIAVAEETGLIVPIGELVLRQACRQWRKWKDAGFPPMNMSVNLSVRQFKQRDLCERVAAVIAETGMDAAFLELELTESVFITNADMSTGVLEKLKTIGIRLAIDDFGTGYSSLSYLKRFPIDILKIDRSFIRDMCMNRENTAIVEAIIALAHALRLQVLAEGVETAEQSGHLKERSCDTAQGFLFSRPIPAEEAVRWFANPVHAEMIIA